MTKTWLITGASRGLGRSITEAALAAGDTVVATARDPGRLADLEARYPDTLLSFALDVTDMAASVIERPRPRAAPVINQVFVMCCPLDIVSEYLLI